MSETGDTPSRPRRTRPLVAAGREPKPEVDSPPTGEPTVTTPPTAPPILHAPAPEPEVVREDHVTLGFDGPGPQRRWTVALRFILVIPHLLWFEILSIAAFVVLVLAWFGALFTGRIPDGLASFLAKWIRYSARIYGYGYFLLTDKYPPFSLDADDYAITLEAAPGRLNRAAVLFRYFLLIPAGMVVWFATLGAMVVSIVGWILTLITGRLPTAIFEANASVLTYQTRLSAFMCMLTAEYPNKLFGERSAATEAPLDDDIPALPATPRIARLVLSRAARRLVGLFLALGVLFGVGSFVLIAVFSDFSGSASGELRDSHAALSVELDQFGRDAQACAINGGIQCLHAADLRLAEAFDQFADDVNFLVFTYGDPSDVVKDARDAAAALRAMGAAPDVESYSAAAAKFQEAAQRFDDDYSQLAFDEF